MVTRKQKYLSIIAVLAAGGCAVGLMLNPRENNITEDPVVEVSESVQTEVELGCAYDVDEKKLKTVAELSMSDDYYLHSVTDVTKQEVETDLIMLSEEEFLSKYRYVVCEDGVRSNLDWKNQSPSDDDLSLARIVCVEAYEKYLNKKAGAQDRYRIEMRELLNEELQQMPVPVFYYVTNDYTLVVSMHLAIYDLVEKTEKEVLIPISVRYGEQYVEIV